jgi:hypothetical protein
VTSNITEDTPPTSATKFSDSPYGPDSVRFTWQGSDEMDPASGAGDAELDEDGLLTGEIRFHDGDDSTFKARRW